MLRILGRRRRAKTQREDHSVSNRGGNPEMNCVGEIDTTRARWKQRPAPLMTTILGNIKNAIYLNPSVFCFSRDVSSHRILG